MSNPAFALKMSATARQMVDECIRSHQFYSIDSIRADLQEKGVEVSRSALGRYVKLLREHQGAAPMAKWNTLVVVVDRTTGQTGTAFSQRALPELLEDIGNGQKSEGQN